MRVSNDELRAILTIIMCDKVPLLPLDYSNNKNGSIIRASLEEKGIIKANHLTDGGMLLAQLVEQYCKAEKHLVINRSYIALIENNKAISFTQEMDGDYELKITDRTALIYAILHEYPDMKKASKPFSIPRIYKETREGFEAMLQGDIADEIILIGWHNGDTYKKYIYYWNTEKCYCFHVDGEMCEELETAEIRRRIVKIMED